MVKPDDWYALHGLQKQVEEGNVKAEKPMWRSMAASTSTYERWEKWNAAKGLSAEDAKLRSARPTASMSDERNALNFKYAEDENEKGASSATTCRLPTRDEDARERRTSAARGLEMAAFVFDVRETSCKKKTKKPFRSCAVLIVDAPPAAQMAALAMRRGARRGASPAGIRTSPAVCSRDAPRARLYASFLPEASTSAGVRARDGPGLSDFLRADPSGGGRCGAAGSSAVRADDAAATTSASGARRTAYVETYGCQMNVSDSEIVASVLRSHDYVMTDAPEDADAILVNTCAIRDGAEAKVWHRLRQLRAIKTNKERANRRSAKRAARDVSGVFDDENTYQSVPVVGVLGCMGEASRRRSLSATASRIVAGPDAYRDLLD